jgi:1-acyl-sn-glycerol-3-phosphate acyltransferase
MIRMNKVLKRWWIKIATVFVVLNTSVKSIVRVRLGKMTRSMADYYIAEWSRRMLQVVDVKIQKVQFASKLSYQAQHCYIIMSNHASHYDIPIIFQTLPGSIRMLAKSELSKIPLFGRMLAENEFPFINRKNRKQAIKDLENAATIMRSGIVLWVAPEGTRARDPSHLGEFKKGPFVLALKSRAIIIPVGIRGSATILPADTWNFNSGQAVEVHVGEPIDSTQFDNENALLRVVEDRISELAAVPKHT